MRQLVLKSVMYALAGIVVCLGVSLIICSLLI